MNLFDVYPLFDINIIKGKGCHVWDENGTEYLDLYGGHAVISIGHAHPHYVDMISKQVATLGFYSNSVINKLQQQVAKRLGKISGYEDYSLFLINKIFVLSSLKVYRELAVSKYRLPNSCKSSAKPVQNTEQS